MKSPRKINIIGFIFFLFSMVFLTYAGFIIFGEYMLDGFGYVLIVSYLLGFISYCYYVTRKQIVIKRGGLTIFVETQSNTFTHGYFINDKGEPICGITVNGDKSNYTYVIGFSKNEENIFVIDPDTGKGAKLMGYQEDEDKP